MKKHSKYCTSISGLYQECLTEIQKADFVELRLDLCLLSKEERLQLYRQSPTFIATHRGDENTNKTMLTEAIENGASFIDLDISRSADHIKEMKEIAQSHQCELIISSHNHASTPPVTEIMEIHHKAVLYDPAYVKIVTTINQPKDISAILSLYQHCDNIIAFGMGELGKITRIAALHCGAPYTYTSTSNHHATAKGQLTVEALQRMEKEMLENESQHQEIEKHIYHDHQ